MESIKYVLRWPHAVDGTFKSKKYLTSTSSSSSFFFKFGEREKKLTDQYEIIQAQKIEFCEAFCKHAKPIECLAFVRAFFKEAVDFCVRGPPPQGT